MLKVMVVEDEEHIRTILGKMIEKNEGCKVVALCENFASAISDFMKHRPDVVFMDIDLGGDSGLECAKAMTEVDPKVKIVFATAHSEYMANAFEIYAFDYLVKPFDKALPHPTPQRDRGQFKACPHCLSPSFALFCPKETSSAPSTSLFSSSFLVSTFPIIVMWLPWWLRG